MIASRSLKLKNKGQNSEACSQKIPQIQNNIGITENERPTENFI